MPTRHSLIQPQDVLIILDFVLPGVYLGFKESKLPDSLHRIERGKKVVKSLSETIGKKVYGECLSLQILLNNATTNAIQAGGRKEKQHIFEHCCYFVFKQDPVIVSKKRTDSKFPC